MKQKLKKIVLIDDHDITNTYHEFLLQQSNCVEEIVIKYSVDKALDYFRAIKNQGASFPELTFLDINMPGWNGWDFLEMLQTFFPKEITQTKIVIVTATPDEAEHLQLDPSNLILTVRKKLLSQEDLCEIFDLYYESKTFPV